MGAILIQVSFVSILISSFLYFLAGKGKTSLIRYARILFYFSVSATISSAAFLLYLIFTHQFQYTYVWDYSSRDLPINLLLSTFYAGQEGSFHLWAFLMSGLGIFLSAFLIKRDKENKNSTVSNNYEPFVMFVFTLIQAFLIFILILKSPYKMVWESFPADVNFGFIPEDGRGLNPLLQNFWMTIHPPILFLGFTSLSIPFSFALAALMKNENSRWLKLAMPWALFSGMVLGLGIMLGGYWAYGVLGWGGYWAWDPVENSSFIPWILIVAGIHSMVSEEKTGRFKRASLLLCILAFLLVLYSTFLTRSGILGDASVHSFVDPGQEVYLFLVVFLSIFAIGSFALLSFRFKSFKPKDEPEMKIASRESALITGTIILCAVAFIITVGTSWPILSKGTIDAGFYNRMNLPLAILIAVINGISILLVWKKSTGKEFLNSILLPFGISVIITIGLVITGVRDIVYAVFIAASFFALFVNLKIALKLISKNVVKAGPYIAHLGIMILFLGIIGSSKYSEETNISLPLNESKDALGYKLTYKGSTPIKGDEEKYHFNVVVEKDGSGFLLQPVMFYSEYSKGILKNPDIANLIYKDLYLSPMALETPDKYSAKDIIKLKKGEETDVQGIKVKFIDFDRSKFSQDAIRDGEETIIGAILEVITKDGKEQVIAEQKMSGGETNTIPVTLKSSNDFTFYLTNVSVQNESGIDIAIVDESIPKIPQSPETLVLTASIKPFINLVWGGTMIMVFGFFFSLKNRVKEIKRKNISSEKIHLNNHNGNLNNNHNNNGNNNGNHNGNHNGNRNGNGRSKEKKNVFTDQLN